VRALLRPRAALRLGILALAGALAAPAAARAQDPAAAVRAAELARFEAQVTRDTAALRRLLAPDLVYIHSNALVEDRDHFIETVATGRIVYDSVTPLEMRHRVFGDAALGHGRVRVRVRMNGQDLGVDLLVSTVHMRREGRWQLVSWQSTRAQ
jgi:ketosteroid isomerase-like protein